MLNRISTIFFGWNCFGLLLHLHLHATCDCARVAEVSECGLHFIQTAISIKCDIDVRSHIAECHRCHSSCDGLSARTPLFNFVCNVDTNAYIAILISNFIVEKTCKWHIGRRHCAAIVRVCVHTRRGYVSWSEKSFCGRFDGSNVRLPLDAHSEAFSDFATCRIRY